MSRWECNAGHFFEGYFFSPPLGQNGTDSRALVSFDCPVCGGDMILSREEGALELLNRIREFIGEISDDPRYGTDSSLVLREIGRLETTIRKLAEEAARP